MQTKFDVLGIGNAIVDVLAETDEGFLAQQRLAKGSMRLVDAAEAERIFDRLGPSTQMSGGSVGNSIAGVASLGGRGAFIGKVADDALGAVYRHDMKALGVSFLTPALLKGAPTARSMILVTPDGERTMNTYLGAAQMLGPDDVDPDQIAAAEIVLLEGYLWDPPLAKDAFRKAARIAHEAGRRVAMSLSDTFCVDRYRREFRELIRTGAIDIVLANAHELRALYETADFETAASALRRECKLAAVTASAEGSYILTPEAIEHVPAAPVERVVDVTGAGDLYAAGFLYGVAKGLPHGRAAALGSLAAAEVIGHFGARPQTSLKALAAANGFKL